MSQRESTLVWLKDLLEHLTQCHQHLQWAEDAETVRLVSETMLSDLERCKRLCESLHRRSVSRVHV